MIQDPFRSMIRSEGVLRYRDLPWRRTRDPYIIWLSEVMLQQTQVPRVETRMPVWLDRFPTVQALAQAAPSDVLDAWQGMGYNRRALALHRAAQRRRRGLGWGVSARDARSGRAARYWPGNGAGHPFVCVRSSRRVSGDQCAHGLFASFLSRCAGRSRSRASTADSSCLSGGPLVRRRMRLRPLPRLKTMPTRRARGITRCWITARILKRRCPIRPGGRRAIAVSPSLRARVAKSAPTSCACCWQRAMGSRRALRLMKLLQALTRWKRQPVAGRSSASLSRAF